MKPTKSSAWRRKPPKSRSPPAPHSHHHSPRSTALLGVDLKAALAMNAEQLKNGLAKKLGADVLVAVCSRPALRERRRRRDRLGDQAKGVDLTQFVPIGTYNDVAGQLAKVSGDRSKHLTAALGEKRINQPAQTLRDRQALRSSKAAECAHRSSAWQRRASRPTPLTADEACPRSSTSPSRSIGPR